MNKFGSVAEPMVACFSDRLDLTPYHAVKNNVAADGAPFSNAMTATDRYWLEKTRSLDWGCIDGPDPYWMNRITWYSLFKVRAKCPARPGRDAQAWRSGDDDGDDDDRGRVKLFR